MSSEVSQNFVGQVLEGRYRVDAFIGRGGMADVYKVWDRQRAVFLAMKVLHPDLAEDLVFLQRFEREAHTLDRLQHPNIVRFYGLVSSGARAYILMDYIDGLSLRKEIALHREGLSPQRVLEIMRPVCAALHYAHQMGRVHCDMKPANIMIHTNGSVFVTDFGISHMSETRTATLTGIGTPAYMAPEQFQPAAPLPTPAADIYALGVTIYEMLTGGQRPFTGDKAQTEGTVTQKIIWEKTHLPPPSPRELIPNLDLRLEAVVMRCLRRDPQARFPTALALYEALQAAIVGESPSTDTPTLLEVPPAAISAQGARQRRLSTRQRRAVLGLTVTLLALALIALGLVFQGGGPGAWFPTRAAAGSRSAAATDLAAISAITPSPSAQPTATLPPTLTPTLTGGGGRIAFASNRSGSIQVWVMDWQGNQRRQITTLPNGACDPAWSPDGRRLAFISPCQGPRSSYPGSKIYLTGLDGQNVEALPLPLGGFDPAWSPDGRQIAFSYIYENKISIGLYNLETQTITELTGHGSRSAQPAWASSGETLAFISDDRQMGEIWLIGADGLSLEIFQPASLTEAFSYPVWSPDGRWILATQKVSNSPNSSLVRLDIQPGGKVTASPFLSEPFTSTHPSFSPDGQWVVFEGWPEATNREIFVASADGKTVYRITNQTSQDFHPAWGPQE